ncbi:hypothetical protein [Ralstonia pseudosolanacearum]|uniref:hypothetical protein n=1 Tax=Ralstonia pseudosolanacearum TaxID=1310165 RepID=UPI0018CFF82C|nr:hypothetical protein [Ralstonia pseudosolanacearum]UWD88497.1 hypothetical protein NY025_07360 [Ralstonia pseudosolanacearum]CAH0445205.1 hypothetical protein LMG9673_04567 [Ralstonia pseudosolanacearum]
MLGAPQKTHRLHPVRQRSHVRAVRLQRFEYLHRIAHLPASMLTSMPGSTLQKRPRRSGTQSGAVAPIRGWHAPISPALRGKKSISVSRGTS